MTRRFVTQAPTNAVALLLLHLGYNVQCAWHASQQVKDRLYLGARTSSEVECLESYNEVTSSNDALEVYSLMQCFKPSPSVPTSPQPDSMAG